MSLLCNSGCSIDLLVSNRSVPCAVQGVVCTLHEGDDFGKLALVNDAPRAASIVLREDNCHFLRVDKEDFNRILRVSFHPPSTDAFTLTAKSAVALCWQNLSNAALKSTETVLQVIPLNLKWLHFMTTVYDMSSSVNCERATLYSLTQK